MTYAICFDFPEADEPVFAWRAPDLSMGFTGDLKYATQFVDEAVAERVLSNSYGHATKPYGVVVEVAT